MKKVILFFILITTIKSQAQDLELEKVTKLQLEEKVHSIDTSAVAAILFKKARTIFKYNLKDGFSTKTEFTIKLKIYKKEGLKWANFEIPYYVGYENLNKEQVSIIKAFTYNLEGGKIVKQKVAAESKFKEKVNELWETKIVTFPNVKEGSIIELKYEFDSENLTQLPVFQYQYNIPVDYAQYVTEIPIIYLYQVIKSGYLYVTVNDKIENSSISYDDGYNHTNYLNFRQIKTIYEVANAPALVEEDYVTNIDDYYGKIKQELKTIQYPDKPAKQIITTWEDVGKTVYQEKEFGEELNKSDYFLNDLKRIVNTIVSKEERLKVIYEFVKNKMNWNKKYGYYTKNKIEDAYEQNTGNVAEINLILTAMLKMGDIDAAPVLLSTRDNGIVLFPNRTKFNYVIASAVIDGKLFLLDATDKLCTINNLPNRVLNGKGHLIKKDGTSLEINLNPNYSSLYNLNFLGKIEVNGEISGQIREQYFDFQALRFREKFSGNSIESIIENEEKQFSGLEIENFELNNQKSLYEPVIEIYSIKNKNVTEIIGDKMYFSPMLYFSMKENPFKQENRQYPVNFSFPSKDKFYIVIDIPDGYEVESLPKSKAIALENKLANFNFTATNTDKQITIALTIDITVSEIPSENYDTLKQFFKLMIEKENEKIVLKKK
jgi:hypothetical protein